MLNIKEGMNIDALWESELRTNKSILKLLNTLKEAKTNRRQYSLLEFLKRYKRDLLGSNFSNLNYDPNRIYLIEENDIPVSRLSIDKSTKFINLKTLFNFIRKADFRNTDGVFYINNIDNTINNAEKGEFQNKINYAISILEEIVENLQTSLEQLEKLDRKDPQVWDKIINILRTIKIGEFDKIKTRTNDKQSTPSSTIRDSILLIKELLQ